MHKDRAEWESICRKCGKCCYEKIDLGAGEIVYTSEPCEHLDPDSNLCKVYARRHEVVPECMSLTEALVRTLHWLPEDCAYVEYIQHLDTVAAVRAVEKRKKRGGKFSRRR